MSKVLGWVMTMAVLVLAPWLRQKRMVPLLVMTALEGKAGVGQRVVMSVVLRVTVHCPVVVLISSTWKRTREGTKELELTKLTETERSFEPSGEVEKPWLPAM